MSSTEQQASGIKRTDLQQENLSVPGREVVQNRGDISPQASAVKHTHPGEEIIYVLEGSLEYQVEGKPPTTVNANEVCFVPAKAIHAVKNVGTTSAAELATYAAPHWRSARSRTPTSARRRETRGRVVVEIGHVGVPLYSLTICDAIPLKPC